MKRKILAAVLSVSMLTLSLAGCGSGGKEASSSDTASGAAAEAQSSAVSGAEAESSTTAEAGSSSAAAETEGKDPGEIKVAGVVFQEDQFMMLMQKGYQDAAAAYGVECMIANTNNDQAKEAELISTYTTQKLDGIAISPLNETSSIQSLKTAYDGGLEIAVGNTKLSDAEFVCGGYTSDNYNLGELTGQEARKFIEENLGGKARVAIVQFKSQLPEQSADRMNGFMDQLEGLDIELVADQDAWLQDAAVQTVSDILTANEASGGVDIIWAANDGGTIGATMAVKNCGKAGETFVFGTDAAEQQAEMLKSDDNILQCVTGQDAYAIGYNTMEVLIKTVMGEKGEYGHEVIVPGIVLTRSDLDAVETFEKDLAERMGQ